MKIKLKELIFIWLLILISLLFAIRYNAINVNLTGGEFPFKNMSIWKLTQYKYVKLLRKSPLCYEPFKAYVEVDKHVQITVKDNKSCITIDDNLVDIFKEYADYNKRFAKNFKVKGATKQKVKQIYNYVKHTEYVPHVKTAYEVFTLRKGDCAGMASAFYVLCKVKHIPVRYIIGWTKSSCHAWNRVKIKGKWYWIDCAIGLWLSRKQFKHRTIMERW